MNDILKNKDIYILDMDGTFYLESNPIEGALDFLDVLASKNKKFMFFTNNSSKSISDYVKKLRAMNVNADENSIMSSGSVTIDYLLRNHSSKSVFLLGTQSLRESFVSAGINLTDEKPDIVVLGFDTTLDYEKIYKGCTFIRNGAAFIATHPDLNCPVKGGLMPDTGSMIKMFTASTGVEPIVMGKPNSFTVEAIESKTGIDRSRMVFVGDRLETDIEIGIRNGAAAVLVMTGATNHEILAASEVKPTLVVQSIAGISNLV